MSLESYIGHGETGSVRIPTASGDGSLAAAESQYFSFEPPAKHVFVHNDAAAAGAIWVAWNSTAAVTTANRYVALTAGQSVQAPPGLEIQSVAIYSAAGSTFGTDFTISGW